jgi:hypothetical protein
MPSAASSELKFDIGHVLFIDIVGYSKLLINQQSNLLETLKKVVRGTEQVRAAEAVSFSNYSGSTGLMCTGDWQRAKETSGTAGTHGNPQRPGE